MTTETNETRGTAPKCYKCGDPMNDAELGLKWENGNYRAVVLGHPGCCTGEHEPNMVILPKETANSIGCELHSLFTRYLTEFFNSRQEDHEYLHLKKTGAFLADLFEALGCPHYAHYALVKSESPHCNPSAYPFRPDGRLCRRCLKKIDEKETYCDECKRGE